DCSIRAFCKALNMEWTEVFDLLVPYARNAQCLLNQKPCYEKALSDLGWIYHSVPRGQKTTVADMARYHKEVAICYVKSGFGTHLVTVKDGKYFDTWDSGSKILYGYFSKGE
ncbi:hypothetical protein, partial [Jutongia sp.]